MMMSIQRVAVIGTGAIGASWTALFLAHGLEVTATDVAPGAEERLREYVHNAAPALQRLGMQSPMSADRLSFTADLAKAVDGAQLVQENGPERLNFKRSLYATLDALLSPEAIIASSSSGLTMSEIQAACPAHPERCVIGHPFNPPHLIPLVEIVGGTSTSEDTIRRVTEFYTALGKRTIRLHKEVPGHVANRLQAALWREVVHLVESGVVSVSDADAAVCWGPGLRWGVMGPALLYHLGGGAGGIEHFFDQFTGPMTAWWKVLGSPEITPALREKIVAGVLEEAGTRSLEELAVQRDEDLLGLLAVRARA
ncbi:3-hydroxyacyl-CoA dehydrogenase NAD-binding domain-containing protein [Variovorax rhizosphaerae]|uniref:3-hydroxyacyl-CoA dehydrogenase NAD-binding domain-containing protein n=1 Tax=Variovorax rhizosphaerae TaxID=1836200 RepID=A0ABU8WXW6_9BURK